MPRFPIVVALMSILDYLFKAAVNYRLTDEGSAEWSDVEAAIASVLGDDDGAEAQRVEASQQRANVRNRQSVSRAKPDTAVNLGDRRPLSED
jgi:hypothetical protein